MFAFRLNDSRFTDISGYLMHNPSPLFRIPLGCLLLCLIGCGETQTDDAATSSSKIAVIDLNRIVEATESTNLQVLEQQRAGMRNRFETMQQNAMNQYQAKQQEFGEEPTEEQQNELRLIQQSAQAQLNQVGMAMSQQVSLSYEQLKNAVRERIRPTVQQFAKEQDLLIVYELNPQQVMAHSKEINITDTILELLAEAESVQDTSAGAGLPDLGTGSPVQQNMPKLPETGLLKQQPETGTESKSETIPAPSKQQDETKADSTEDSTTSDQSPPNETGNEIKATDEETTSDESED